MKQPAAAPESNYTLVGLLVAPLIASVGLAVWGFTLDGDQVHSIATVLIWTLIFYGYALIATIVIGLPCFLLLREIGLIRWWSAIASGFFVGSLVLLAVDSNAVFSRPNDFAVWGTVGGLSALVFWVVRLYGLRKLENSKLSDPTFGEIQFRKRGWSGAAPWLDGSHISVLLERDQTGPRELDRSRYEEFKKSFVLLIPEIRGALFTLWQPEMNQPHWRGMAHMSAEELWPMLELDLITMCSDGHVELLFAFSGEFWPDGMFNVEVNGSTVKALKLDD